MALAVICLRIVVLHERLASAPVHEGPAQRMAGGQTPGVATSVVPVCCCDAWTSLPLSE
jgi:hypothetical protein